MGYVSLHTHSTFSLLDGYGTPAMLVERAKSLGHTALAISDHGNTSAHVQLQKAAKAAGIKPIYGCEFYITPDVVTNQRKKQHITVLARNLEGYRNLLHLSSLAYQEGHFYYLPTIDINDLIAHQAGLIVLSGCQSGLLSKLILEDKLDEARFLAEQLRDNLDCFFLEVQPLDLDDSRKVNEALRQLSYDLLIPVVATNDVHYVNPGEEQVQHFLGMIKRNKDVLDDWGTMAPQCHLARWSDMMVWGATSEELHNTAAIADLCETYDLPKAKLVKYPGVADAYQTLVELCRQGWVKRKVRRAQAEVYKERVLYELQLIRDKDFVDYFLVVADMVQWAKDQNILVGPARGSVAGSLVSYFCGITEVDPIKWDLLFERFIDPNRNDFPDIDLDFQDDRREEVKTYLRTKYGVDKVANIAGYSEFHPKSLLDDIGRVYHVPRKTIEDAKNELIENGGTKGIEQVLDDHLPLYKHLVSVIGMVRQLTIHAAGVVVATESLSGFTTIGRDGLMLDYRDAGELGLLKIDVLSLSTLTVLHRCLDAIGQTTEWLYSVPLDDAATMKAFAADNFMGVFQYEGQTTKQICKKLQPTTFNELIDINALSRPGPLQSGATQAYIKGLRDDIHPVVTRWTERSRGQILFQEQIMRILREAGNLGWGDVNVVRKLITKKEGLEKLGEIKARFMQAFKGSEELGEEIWKRCGESGAYGFNISHSTSYTFLGYFCMFLKVHYPLQFYWANMVLEPDNAAMLREFARQGGRVYGVKFGKSRAGWTIDGEGLRAGYLTLKGIGPKSAAQLEKGVKPKGKALEILQAVGAFEPDQEEADYLGIKRLTQRLAAVNDRTKARDLKVGYFVRVAGLVMKMEVKNLREYYAEQGKDWDAEASDPEKCTYVNLMLGDETGEVPVTVNRYMCADPLYWEVLTELKSGEILDVRGEYTDNQKVRAIRVRNYTREAEGKTDVTKE